MNDSEVVSMNTTESSLNRSRRLSNRCSSMRSLIARRAQGCDSALLVRGQFLAQPGHGTVEVVQGQPVHAGDGVIGHPLLAGPVRAGHQDPVQYGGEDGPLDRKLEPALSQQILDHGLAAGLLPQPLEEQRGTDALGQHARALKVRLESREQQNLLAVARPGGEQGRQAAPCREFIGAAEGGNDLLAYGAALALVRDDLQVAARPGLLDAEEHGALSRTPRYQQFRLIGNRKTLRDVALQFR